MKTLKLLMIGEKMVTRKTWNEFRETGLFLLVNQFLHIFGWTLVVEVAEDEEVTECYPARTKFRGFGENSISAAYQRISKYMADNAAELYEEAKE